MSYAVPHPLSSTDSAAARGARCQQTYLVAAAVFIALGWPMQGRAEQVAREQGLFHVDYRRLVSRADLTYESPVYAPVEGIPIGNGRMGTTVWTTPSSVKFKINRCDVFASDKYHAGHQYGTTDYCRGCAWLEIDLGGEPLARGKAFGQSLSVYDAVTTVEGEGVRLRCFISAVSDVLVVQLHDQRPEPHDVRVTVSMWRDPIVTTTLTNWPAKDIETGTHTVRYDFSDLDDGVQLVQSFHEVRTFREEQYDCSSAVAARVVGSLVSIMSPTDRARSIVIPAKKGKTMIAVSSAASFSHQADVGTEAMKLVDAASKDSYDGLRAAHTDWWHRYWSRTFVHLKSADGVADFMERLRTLHMYYMAATSRGEIAPSASGLLFHTLGDVHHYGAQYWLWGSEMPCFPMFAADAMDTVEPYFRMYVRQLPDCRIAARQRWGIDGAFFPETTPFDGPVVLPKDVARIYQDVLLGRKPATELSPRDLTFCQYESHLFYTTTRFPHETKDPRPFTNIGQLTSTGSELAIAAWWRYRYSGDKAWLAEIAYPLLRDTVEFYRHLVRKGDDGRYHIHRTSAHEQVFPVDDCLVDLAAIRGTAPLAIRAAEILAVDAQLRPKWQELVDNLAPYPMGSDPRSKAVPIGVLSDDTWSVGYLGKDPVRGASTFEDIWVYPIHPFEIWTLETRDVALDKIVKRTLDLVPEHRGVMGGNKRLSTRVPTPISIARAGRGEDLPAIMAAYCGAFAPFLTNGLSLFEAGIQSMGLEHSGLLTTVMQEGLLQSVSPRPGEPEIISIAPAWPKDWNASFRLLARGGFLVSASVRDGDVEFVAIESRLGELCRLRNPWNGPVNVERNSFRSQRGANGMNSVLRLDGEILQFETKKGQRFLVLPQGRARPATHRISPEPATGPVSYSFKLPSGVTVGETLGRPRNMEPRGLQAREDSKLNLEYTKYQ